MMLALQSNLMPRLENDFKLSDAPAIYRISLFSCESETTFPDQVNWGLQGPLLQRMLFAALGPITRY